MLSRFMRCLVLTLLPNVLVYLRLLSNSSSIRLSQVGQVGKVKKKLEKKSYFKLKCTELGTLEWWLSRSMLDPLFFLISRLT